MFLFTTPAETTRSAASGLVPAIKTASARTGVDFSYLLGTAVKESGLDPQAAAKTSSARGAFQFIEQTWLGVFKDYGAAEGQGRLAAAIETRHGVHFVRDPALRDAILKLREDPAFSSVMAGHLTRGNAAQLAQETGLQPGSGDLYAAHVLGAKGAADLLRAVANRPDQTAAALFPQAAKANVALFYDKAGQPVSVDALYRRLSRELPPARLKVADETNGAAVAPLYKTGGAPLYGLFRTEGAQPFTGLDPSGQPMRPQATGEAPSAKPSEPMRTETGKPLNLGAYRKAL
jgi:hypothetical protein